MSGGPRSVWHYAELVSVEGDACPERQSSAPCSAASSVFARVRRFARFAFALFVLLHLALEAFRAPADATRPEPGLELQPWFVALVLLVVWLPFAAFAVDELGRMASEVRLPRADGQARALAVAERLCLLLVVLFAVLHGICTAWPLLDGSMLASDIRPELVLILSSTNHGVPARAVVYLCAVGAASFYAARQARAALEPATARVARGVAALGVLAYLLGSYAVIRCAGGELFP
jgi:hypothetical protein